MKTAIFQYKCRLCGKVYNDAHTSENNALMTVICSINKRPMPKGLIGMQPELIGIHAGCKSGCGVSDLIGYIIEE